MQITIHLRELREAQGLTQQQLADKAGMSINSLQSAERGKSLPGAYNLCLFAKALGCTLNDLVTFE